MHAYLCAYENDINQIMFKAIKRHNRLLREATPEMFKAAGDVEVPGAGFSKKWQLPNSTICR